MQQTLIPITVTNHGGDMNVKNTYKKYKNFIDSTSQALYDSKMKMRKAIEERNRSDYKITIRVATEIAETMREETTELEKMNNDQLTQLLAMKNIRKSVKDLCVKAYHDFGDRINIVQCLIMAYSMEHDTFFIAEDMPDIKTDVINYKNSKNYNEPHEKDIH